MCQVNKNINNDFYNERYLQLKRLHKQEIVKAKKAYNDQRISQSKNINKTCWNIINEHKNTKPQHDIHIEADGKVVDTERVPGVFNDFFINVASRVAAPSGGCARGYKLFNSMYVSPVSATEVEVAIMKCCKKQSAGVDAVPGPILQGIKEIISWPLVLIINKSFERGIYPANLKTSKVIPVFKRKGQEEDIKNYRPIAVQCQLSKVFEYCFHQRLCNFLEKYNVLSSSQHGYRKSKSTITALEDITSAAYAALNQKKRSLALFFDMSRAFDSVDHKLLIQKLCDSGVRGAANRWISSYLTNRDQIVYANGFRSKRQLVDKGVPQGTILGPLLFCVFINDLPLKCSAATTVTVYADDTNITLADTRLVELIRNNTVLSHW